MDVNTLVSLGFEISGGAIDRNRVNYGVMLVDGPKLTQEGEALVKSLSAAAAAPAVQAEPKKPRRKAVMSDDFATMLDDIEKD
jgi:hypothetical protein